MDLIKNEKLKMKNEKPRRIARLHIFNF